MQLHGNMAVPNTSNLVACMVPKLWFVTHSAKMVESANLMSSVVLRDFLGVEDCDDETRQALLDLSFHLSVHNIDEAHKSVKHMSNVVVWANMANMCVKTKRL